MELSVPMADWWEADAAFLEGLRDREVLLAMVGEVAGPTVAAANAGEKGKTLKAIIRDHLAGAGGREKREGWVPRWMTFPPSAYTARGGVGTVAAHASALDRAEAKADFDPEAEPPLEAQDEGSGSIEPDPDGDESRALAA